MMATARSKEIRCVGPSDPIAQPPGRRLVRPLARSNHRLRRTSPARQCRDQSEHQALAARCQARFGTPILPGASFVEPMGGCCRTPMRLVRFRRLDLPAPLIVYWIAGCRHADVDGTPIGRCPSTSTGLLCACLLCEGVKPRLPGPSRPRRRTCPPAVAASSRCRCPRADGRAHY